MGTLVKRSYIFIFSLNVFVLKNDVLFFEKFESSHSIRVFLENCCILNFYQLNDFYSFLVKTIRLIKIKIRIEQIR